MTGGRSDPLAAVVDELVSRWAHRVAACAEQMKERRRERDPLRRLGLAIIDSSRQSLLEARAAEAVCALAQDSSCGWWLASGVRSGVGNRSLLIASADRFVCIHVNGLLAAREAASSLRALTEDSSLKAHAIVAVEQLPISSSEPTAGMPAFATVAQLPTLVGRILEQSGPYEPERHPRFSRVLYDSQVSERQRSLAMTHLLDQLARRWLIAENVLVPGLPAPIDVLVAGPGGVYVCAAGGIDAVAAAFTAIANAGHLAAHCRGTGVHVTPVVLAEPCTSAHQLEVSSERRAWVLPADQLAEAFRAADRSGIAVRGLRRVRRPAPGWEYRVVRTKRGWAYAIRDGSLARVRPWS